ncbi:FtsK/SpoIIIE domain-containing protein [Pseudonocardia sp. MH-G8]|uniref:FtsK/SpoIIIE domain-containing protein n=1 Tax=Pseudonocardia sp. MH-G8 TaxID=1854588 RepID=UPI000BA181A3|nr:FtsK/SpoIIIE domain-containing protein [Pseudonocardia sp. MH-G8]OZM79917.1 cell division protein FtsK [Pseudonocardia sp. MH-G8]
MTTTTTTGASHDPEPRPDNVVDFRKPTPRETPPPPADGLGGQVTPLVLDAEIVDEDDTAAARPGSAVALRRAGAMARRQTVHVVTTAVRHPRTRTVAKGTARQVWFPLAGAVVVARRWQDTHGAHRYERMMRAAETAGDHEALLEWESRDVAEKQRRHQRVMDWITSPLELVKALGVGAAAAVGLLLALGVVLAVANRDIAQVIGPITAVVNAVAFLVWFLTAYGALLLTGLTVAGIAYLWAVGRAQVQPPAWVAPATAPTGRDVVPDEGAILNALRNLGLPPLDRKVKEGWQPRWVQPTCRDGKGWRTQLELPPGVTVEMINGKKPVLAHNLVRKAVEVWPTEPRDAAGVLDLWVADQGILTRPIDPWPLLAKGTVDYFKGVPCGHDQRGETITGRLMASNYAIAGTMGSGKTSLVICLLCGAILDPLVDIDVFCMAYNVDYDPLKPRLRTLVKGDEDEHVVAAMDGLRELRSEVSRRGKLLEELGGDETKVTRELAQRDARLRPRVAVFDECQELFRHKEFGEEAKELAIKVMTKARKCAITLMWVTPAPSADSLPRDLAKTASHRACYAIGDHQGNDAILGTGAHRQGITATTLVPGEDVGTAMASGFATRPGLLRSFYIRKDREIDQITPVVERAMAARQGAGITTAPAAAVEPVDELDPLADIAAVLVGHKRLRTQEVLSLLAAHNRSVYGKWTFADLADALPDAAKPYKTGGHMQVSAARVAEAIADRDTTDHTDDSAGGDAEDVLGGGAELDDDDIEADH